MPRVIATPSGEVGTPDHRVRDDDGHTILQASMVSDSLMGTIGDVLTVVGNKDDRALFDFRPGAAGIGNVALVDQVRGDDSTAAVGAFPFQTIGAALVAVAPGQLVWIAPGIYNETVIIPADIHVRGMERNSVIIQRAGVAINTDLLTMGDRSSIEDVELVLTSAAHVTLRGVVFPGTSTSNAQLLNVSIVVDNSLAGAGNSKVVGIESTGTGVVENVQAVRGSTINVLSVGTGVKRGILVSTASAISVRETTIELVAGAGGVDYAGVETSHANAVATMIDGRIDGNAVGADILRTLGTLRCVGTYLRNSNAGGLGFTAVIGGWMRSYCDPGGAVNGTRFMYPGTATPVAGSEPSARIAQERRLAKSISVQAVVGPGAARVDTWMVRKNGVDTGLTVSLTGAQTNNTNDTVSVSFNVGDRISVKQVVSAGSTTSEAFVDVEMY